MKISSVRFLLALFFLGLMFFARMLAPTLQTRWFTIVTHPERSIYGELSEVCTWQLADSLSCRGTEFGGVVATGRLVDGNCPQKENASQEVLLLRGWLNSWPVRSIVSQTVSVSSFFLLSSSLP